MSLSARERRCLNGIQDALACSDPRLASLFATFSRLSRQEDMPPTERLRTRVDRVTTRGRQARTTVFGRLRVIIIAPIALATTCAALVIGGWSSGTSPCKVKPAATQSQHGNAAPLPAGSCQRGFLRTELSRP